MDRSKPPVSEIESIYRERYRHFLRVATAIVGDEASGHDAVQEAFSRVLTQRASYRGEGPLEAWVWRVVVNAARHQRRTRAARRESRPRAASRGAGTLHTLSATASSRVSASEYAAATK